MKKLFTLLFALIVGVGTMSAEIIEHVQIGDLYYNLDTDKLTAEVTYNPGLYYGDIAIPASLPYDGIDYRVTSIGNHAFNYCYGLTSIEIPNGITNIEVGAFEGCTGLTSLTIPNSVTSIGDGAFVACSGLISIEIPNSVTSIGNAAFESCSGLKSLTIPNSVTSIGNYAFTHCGGLTSIVVENGNPVYDSRDNCNAIIETSTNTLLTGCENTTIPNSIISIGVWAFSDSHLASIEIPNSVSHIGSCAFYGCSDLTSIEIPESVVNLGENVFVRCSKLASIVVNSENPVYDSRDKCNAIIETVTNILIAGCENTIIPNSVTGIGSSAFSNCTGLTSITIPNSVTSIGDGAFYNCIGLTSLEISASVESIGTEAFYACSLLTSIEIPNSVTSIGTNAFYYVLNIEYDGVATGSPWGAKNVNGVVDGWFIYSDPDKTHLMTCSYAAKGEIEIPNSVIIIEDGAFWGCGGLTSVTIGNNVTSIGERTFWNCIGLTSVTLPNSVTSIGDYAFENCSGLTSVTIPNSVKSIGNRAFSGCSGLTTLTIGNKVTNIGERAFDGCSNLTSVVLPETIKNIGNQAFINCAKLSLITLGNSLDSIGEWAFAYCSNLISIEIPNSATWIGDYAFQDVWNVVYSGEATGSPWGAKYRNCFIVGTLLYNDESMTKVRACHPSVIGEVTIPNTVVTIADYAFNNITGITSITFGSALDSIGKAAFRGCTELTNVAIPEHVSYIGWGAFDNCDKLPVYDNIRYADTYMVEPIDKSLSTYSIKDGTKWIGGFNRCENMTSIEIPNSAVSILADAFRSCYSLTSITIPDAVLEIGSEAFCKDTNLINVTLSKSLSATGEFAFARCSHLTSIDIPNGIKVISRGCFDGAGLQMLTLPSSVSLIEDMGLAGCTSLESLTCEATTPPACGKFAFDEIDTSIPVYVPAESVEAYKAAEGWKEFTNIQPIQAEEVPVTEIEAEPTENSVVIEWPKVAEATVYTIEIRKDGELICTLTFNEQGQLQGITFAKPSRNGGRNSQVRMAIQTATGWQYTISGLDPDTEYTYSVVAKKNASDTETLYSESISFTTKQTPTGVDEVTDQPSEVRKLLRNGQLYIFRDGKLFNAQGARVK